MAMNPALRIGDETDAAGNRIIYVMRPCDTHSDELHNTWGFVINPQGMISHSLSTPEQLRAVERADTEAHLLRSGAERFHVGEGANSQELIGYPERSGMTAGEYFRWYHEDYLQNHGVAFLPPELLAALQSIAGEPHVDSANRKGPRLWRPRGNQEMGCER